MEKEWKKNGKKMESENVITLNFPSGLFEMSLCNLTKQELAKEGISLLGNCPVVGCGLPVARHRDETVFPSAGMVLSVD